MKSLRLLTGLLLAFAASLFASSAYAFEGQVTMKMTVGKDSQTLTYYVKGTKVRMEFTPQEKKNSRSGTMAMIADWEKREMLMVMPEQKMYMVQSMKDVEAAMADNKQGDFKPTGRKEKIAGYEAEEYAGTSDGKRMEFWVTNALGKFIMANQARGGGPFGRSNKLSDFEKFMRKNEFFALRVIQRGKNGTSEEFRMEVVNVDKAPQSDSLFQPPADFERMEMPSLGGALKGLIPGGAQ
jgi:hypothetical protein